MDNENNNPLSDLVKAEDAFSDFYGSAKEIISRYTQCSLCGSNLHFTHVTDFARNMTQETAACPECNIKIRRVMHKLQ